MSKGRKLGRGLGALLSDGPAEQEREAPVSAIVPNPGQPRRVFGEEALSELADSIRAHGVVQPLIVRELAKGKYELIAGERRLRAAKLAGLDRVPVLVKDYDEEQSAEIALIENLQREDLNPAEEGEAYRSLMKKYGYTQERLAEAVGKSRPYVANMLRLAGLPKEVLEKLASGALTVGQVRPLLGLASQEEQTALARRIEKENLSARQAEALAAAAKARKKAPSRKRDPAEAYFKKIENDLKLSLGMGVRIKNGKGKNGCRGSVVIDYGSEEEFQRLVDFLKNGE